jgi:hypothetical protein
VYEPWGGDAYRRSGIYHETIEPGTYRIELSTPDNLSPYVLVVGTDHDRLDVSYFEMVKRVSAVKAFYGKSSLAMIVSPYLYVPLVVLLFALGTFYWYRRCRRGGK